MEPPRKKIAVHKVDIDSDDEGKDQSPTSPVADIVLPDTAHQSYKGTFVTDVYDAPASTVKQPDFLYFAKGVVRVLKQVHP